MSLLMWVVATLVALVGALQWAQGAPVIGVALMLLSIGVAPLQGSRSFRREPG